MFKNIQDLTVQVVKVSELDPAPYNPRRWSENAIEQLKDSIKRFGVVDPILVNNAPGRKKHSDRRAFSAQGRKGSRLH